MFNETYVLPLEAVMVGDRVERTPDGARTGPLVPYGTLGTIVEVTERRWPVIVWDGFPDARVTYRNGGDRYRVI